MSEELKHGGACDVPRDVATCPECGGALSATRVDDDVKILCTSEHEYWAPEHTYDHPAWDRVDGVIERWAGAVDG